MAQAQLEAVWDTQVLRPQAVSGGRRYKPRSAERDQRPGDSDWGQSSDSTEGVCGGLSLVLSSHKGTCWAQLLLAVDPAAAIDNVPLMRTLTRSVPVILVSGSACGKAEFSRQVPPATYGQHVTSSCRDSS
jgi:hypothetical protein